MFNKELCGNKYFFILVFLPLVFIYGCATNQRMASQVKKTFRESKIMGNYHVGFALADTNAEKLIYQEEADKYFTTASNMKLLTFYAALKMLPDSIPSIRYVIRGDSLIFWGNGDPSFLQSRLKGGNTYHFLQSATQKLFFAEGRYTGGIYGQGWAWDDYNDYYQAEINELPLMDNLVKVKVVNGALSVSPQLFASCFYKDSTITDTTFKITRAFNSNVFTYPNRPAPAGFTQEIPYKIGTAISLSLLSDTLHKPVQLIHMALDSNAKTVYNMKKTEVLREMMLPSDNFIAEQLFLVSTNQFQQQLNTADAIQYISKKYFSDLPDKPHWVDGSGLSRMNLITPRDIIKVLSNIYKEVGSGEKLFSLLPAGGKSGTLKNAYPKTDSPFVFGKTGSFSNNYNQSGYIVTKKGKVLLFSFMNNHFVQPTAEVRKEMARIVTFIHEKF